MPHTSDIMIVGEYRTKSDLPEFGEVTFRAEIYNKKDRLIDEIEITGVPGKCDVVRRIRSWLRKNGADDCAPAEFRSVWVYAKDKLPYFYREKSRSVFEASDDVLSMTVGKLFSIAIEQHRELHCVGCGIELDAELVDAGLSKPDLIKKYRDQKISAILAAGYSSIQDFKDKIHHRTDDRFVNEHSYLFP